ncbi:spaetzle-processing enzyme-like [Toxorhynchites rutilus septentrionalis]|uniref:spaetzle-processing enzyme-like n=1 Tax=Toxorhynchites rutilus septentrionalis TaxID=329112 RepID=UPI0024787727|nr:spaetzle-processing enzyme-like [Toxorhynchites rutilus septentrionalis]
MTMGSKAIGWVFPVALFLMLIIASHCASRGVPCGQKQLTFLAYVYKGQAALEAEWPWHAAIFQKQRSGEQDYICGGTVISENFVLTAAHCTISFRMTLSAEDFTVKLGLHNKSYPSEHTRSFEVVEIIRHDAFNINNLQNDIALLRTEKDISYSDYIQPICLWPVEKSDLNSVIGSSGTVAGWGVGDGYKLVDILQQATLSVVDYATCLKSKPEHFSKLLSDDKSNYCAGNQNMTNVCDGDSGGGMYFKVDNAWYIRGIVSAGARSEKGRHCDPQQFVTFTDIPYYLKWIVQHQEVVKKRNLLNLGDCGLDTHNITTPEPSKPVFLQYPWTAMLEFRVEGTPSVQTICNGALIHPRFVITVGHCVDSAFRKLRLKSVRLGEYNLKTNPDKQKTTDGKEISTTIQSIDIEKVFKHPHFNNPRYDNNIALLKLKYPADVARPNVKPICLPTLEDFNEVYTISGWKRVGQLSHVLERNTALLEDKDTCRTIYGKMKVNLVNDANQICGTYYHKQELDCFHFMSGAPLQYVKNADRKNQYFLKGLFSLGFPNCQLNYTDVFTNVNSYTKWIASVVDAENV